ncbi:hypothetical protein GIB67_026808 [Kingdonia uniflora]|uniref:Uncharacterized protein n=1 Tax=Kingdonia uniflora TaxID=39325 RepID=A0A7J7MHS0_9MAGN|nr:hypothetical protein GIB67_026808 [Kingdonia uniflora]
MDESNMCDINHLEADARLPPRKRLLAGLKKQSSSPSSCDISSRLPELLISSSSGSHLSAMEIVDASRSAALVAEKVAAAARARAEEKAAVAGRAVTIAKNALELLASFSDLENTRKVKYFKKNKSKKHVSVKVVHKKKRNRSETDEEMARKLHRSMNSSPRILKSSNNKIRIPKKHRTHPISEIMEERPIVCVNNAAEGDTYGRENMGKMCEMEVSKYSKTDDSKMGSFTENGEGKDSYLKGEKALEATVTVGRKRGRIKQKKLSLSLCAIRDRVNSQDDEPKVKRPTKKCSLFPAIPSNGGGVSVEAVPKWKFKEFNAPDAMPEVLSCNRYVQIRQSLQDLPC